MKIQNISSKLLYLAALGAMLSSSFGLAWAQSQQPDFTKLSDYLNGERRVFPVDDLVYGTVPYGHFQDDRVWLLESKDLKFTQPPAQVVFPTQNQCQLARDSKGARLFNTANDWIVTIKGTPESDQLCGDSALLSWRDPKNIAVERTLRFPTQAVYNLEVTIADLNQDGYDDVIVTDATRVTIFSAVDPTDPSKGLKQVAQSTLGTAILNPNHISARNSHGEVAVADFNGDGALDVIEAHVDDVAVPSWGIYGLSVCPKAGVFLFTGSTDPAPYECKAQWEVHKIKPDGQLQAQALGGPVLTGEETWHIGGTTDPPRLVPGNFMGQPNSPPQLFADLGIFTGFSEPAEPYFEDCDRQPPRNYHPYARQYELWRFSPALKPMLASQSTYDYSTGFGPTDSDYCPAYFFQYREDYARVARLHMSGSGIDRDQVVLFAKEPFDESRIKILTVADDGTISLHGNERAIVNGEKPIGMDVGRFAPPDNKDGSANFDRQIGLLSSTELTAYSVDERWSLTAVSTTALDSPLTYSGYAAFDGIDGMMGALDAQGRSVLLGTPIRVIADGHLQPDLVLAIPPMHVDYIKDFQGEPTVLNLTVSPNGFNTQYSFVNAAGSSSSTSNTTDVGNSVGGSIEQSLTFGIPDVASVKLKVNVAGKQAWENSAETKDANYLTQTDSLTATTGFADHLFYKSSRLNTWYYPILGKQCPDQTTNCAPAALQQQYIQFSAPDQIISTDGDATTQEWYQPVNEPGNLFSYPWNLEQIKKVHPTLVPLTNESWGTIDTSTTAVKTDWKAGGSGSITTGSVNKWNLDTDISVTHTVTVPAAVYEGGEYKVSYGHSSSQEVQNVSTTTLDSTTGIQVNKPGFSDSVASHYFYYFGSYILGETPIADSLSGLELTRPNGQKVGQQVFGPLTVAFVADPFHLGASPWWQQAYTLPDIGLNHPARWTWDSATKKVSFNEHEKLGSSPNPETVLNDVFYHMKGLFIIEDSDPDNTEVQRSTATAGDKMRLTARVYNYSLADMPSGSKVHVRFYGQLYKNAALSGDAFLIGESTTDGPIPGFNSDHLGNPSGTRGEYANWVKVSTTFDTTPYPGQLMVFWVVAWAQDESGKLIQEQNGHGLTENPSGMTFKQITEVPVETYSNNVGMYDTYTPFYIAPRLHRAAAALAEPKLGDPHLLNTNDVLVEAPTGQLRRRSLVRVTIHNTTGGELRAEPVVLYDGDPAIGGKAFDMQRIPHVAPGDTYVFRTFFIPQTGGNHNIFVRVGHDSGTSANPALTTMVVH